MPKVSIITTVKNGESFIEETIKSVINQTFKDWEYIIVDDGSTDKTKKIINDYLIKDNRIKLVETVGIGRGKALNLAIKKSKGNYIANIDADDPSHPRRIEIQLKCFEENPIFTALVSNSIIITENQNPIWGELKIRENIQLKDITISKKNPFFTNSINHSSAIFKKEYLVKVGMYNEKRKLQFDFDLWIRLSLMNYKIGIIPISLASKRIHDKQSYERRNRGEYLKSALLLNKKIIEELSMPKIFYIFIYAKYLYGFLPNRLRMYIKKIVSSLINFGLFGKGRNNFGE